MQAVSGAGVQALNPILLFLFEDAKRSLDEQLARGWWDSSGRPLSQEEAFVLLEAQGHWEAALNGIKLGNQSNVELRDLCVTYAVPRDLMSKFNAPTVLDLYNSRDQHDVIRMFFDECEQERLYDAMHLRLLLPES